MKIQIVDLSSTEEDNRSARQVVSSAENVGDLVIVYEWNPAYVLTEADEKLYTDLRHTEFSLRAVCLGAGEPLLFATVFRWLVPAAAP